MNTVNFTFIFKSGKVSKITVTLKKEELEKIESMISNLEGKIKLESINNPNSVFVVDLNDCSAVEYLKK
jgi:hypothetical protein